MGAVTTRWWSQTGSNRRPLACHASALPTELWPHSRSWEAPAGRTLPKRGEFYWTSSLGARPNFSPSKAPQSAFVRGVDVEVEVFVLFLVFLKEHIGIVLADVLDLFDTLDIGNLFLSRLPLRPRPPRGETISGASGVATSATSTSSSSSSSSSTRSRLRAAVLLEIGARIGLAGIGRDDRILVQVVELLAGLGVFPLGTADVFGQVRTSLL